MPAQTLKQQKVSQIKALRRMLAVTIFGVASLLVWQAITLSRTQLDYQNKLMRSVSEQVLKELSQILTTQKLKLALFHSDNVDNFNAQYDAPNAVTEKIYQSQLAQIKSEFPSSRLYTLIATDGTNLLEHITGKFLPDCREEVIETAKTGKQQRLFLHRSQTSSHYDLILPRDSENKDSGYFFVAFNIENIARLLKKYQLPYQQLFLLRNDKAGFIELSSEDDMRYVSTQLLDTDTLSDFQFSLAIPDTRWSFAIRLEPETQTNLLFQALWQSFTTWSIVTLLLYLAFRIIQRNLELKFHSQKQLAESRQRAETIINSVNEAVFSINKQHQITFANHRACVLTGKNARELVGTNLSDVCLLYYHSDKAQKNVTELIATLDKDNFPEQANLMLKLENANDLPVAVRIASIENQENELVGYTITIEDLSTAVELSKRLIYHENKDSLTGLDNRRQLEKKISELLNKENDLNSQLNAAVVLIDLDKFQLLNTAHGFEAGDEFLKRIAILLRNTIDNPHCLSRLSSDEFVVVLNNVSDETLANICEEIKLAMRNFEFAWKNEIMTSSVCLGIVKLDNNFASINDVLAAADHASRLAKSKGNNITQFYQTDDPEIKKHAEDILRYSDLKKAISEERFVLYRQAIHSIESGDTKVKKFELLLRMLDEAQNIVSPYFFLPVAEKYGLMAKIDRWVIHHTFSYLSALGDKDTAHYNINISSRTLSEKYSIQFVEQLFEEYPISPQRINFEITETSAISYLDNALAFMHAMKSRGCTFSLDDFGTGLASFDYLKKLPIDYLKIDGVFVKDIQANANDFAFLQAIQKISHQMGIKTVAEFVENDIIFNMLKDIGIDYAQGYAIHKPEPWYSKTKAAE